MNRRDFLASSIAGAAAAALPAAGASILTAPVGLARSAKYPEATSRLTVKNPSRITLLQLTDLHFFCAKKDPQRDQMTIDSLKRLRDAVEPELLLVTGDLWHDNPEGRGEEYMRFALEQITALGVPWLFTWGNHDQLDDYVRGHDLLADAAHSLYRGGVSGGNYTVELVDAWGKPRWELMCLNSHTRGLGDEQRQWLRDLRSARGADSAPGFALVHIPLKQFDDAWLAGDAGGVKLERVSHEGEDGGSLALLQDLGGVRACFCGHDHVNNYRGSVGGIELVFGRATGAGGYGWDRVPKGATVILVNAETGGFGHETVCPDGSRWQAEPGRRIEAVADTPWAAQVSAQ